VLREIDRQAASGYPYLVILPILSGGVVYGFVRGALDQSAAAMVVTGVLAAVLLVSFAGFFMVHPNEVRVLQLFGAYVGTTRTPGLRYANPFYTKRRVSVRIRNFETEKLKVNDENSNPIEIAAVVVWRVVDSAEALFEVDDFEEYVHVQSESALRGLATQYPYDAHTDGEKALSSHLGEIAEQLQALIQERLNKAGVEVIEARISHLAYAPEIASAMLQRQQASAIIAARQKIVEGAVGMVEQALNALTGQGIVQLDEERKAAMVSNLLVVLCGDRAPQPVINTGTLYQ
jgi:regulator of protease activity HflC (stomatin/prohibitin superfamily)